jgi:hypothetical protein
MQNNRSPLKQVLGAAVGCCPAYHSWVERNLLRFCPLQVEAISTLEDSGWTMRQMYDLHVSIFAPTRPMSMLSFGCAHYKGVPKPTGDRSFGKPIMGGFCPLEEAVVDSLIQLIL